MSRHEALNKSKRSIIIGLTETEVRALVYFDKKHFTRGEKPELNTVARYILQMALQHPREITLWFNQLVKYSKAEGMDKTEHALGCIAAQPIYRRTKVVIV